MKTAATLDDLDQLEGPDDVFDVYRIYAQTVLSDPRRPGETAERQGYFHPSSVGMCARANVYCARSETFKLNLGVVEFERFWYGHTVHDHVQTVLEEVSREARKQGLTWSFTREVPYNKEADRLFADLRLGGTADGVIEVGVLNEWLQRMLLEIKSMKDEYWEAAKGPKLEHELQAHLYAFRLNCPIVMYWYFNKNTGKHRVFVRKFSWETFHKAIDRLEMFNANLDNGTLPDREESWYFCTYCEYKHTCEPDVVKPRGRAPKVTTPRAALLRKVRQRTGGKK